MTKIDKLSNFERSSFFCYLTAKDCERSLSKFLALQSNFSSSFSSAFLPAIPHSTNLPTYNRQQFVASPVRELSQRPMCLILFFSPNNFAFLTELLGNFVHFPSNISQCNREWLVYGKRNYHFFIFFFISFLFGEDPLFLLRNATCASECSLPFHSSLPISYLCSCTKTLGNGVNGLWNIARLLSPVCTACGTRTSSACCACTPLRTSN